MHLTYKLFKLLATGFVVGVLVACGGNTTSTSEAANNVTKPSPVALAVDAYRPAADILTAESPLKARDLTVAPIATNIILGVPISSLTSAARKNNEIQAEELLGKPLQIGFGREVLQTASAAATNQMLKWHATKSGGQVSAINFTSTGAKGMRVGLLVDKLPESATLRFYANGAVLAFEIKGADVLAVLAKNLASGDTSNDARTYR